MEYSILYYTKEDVYNFFSIHIEKQGELVIVKNEAKLVLTYSQNMDLERDLIRSYVVNASLIEPNSFQIFDRYNIKRLKEKKKMGLTKEKNMIY